VTAQVTAQQRPVLDRIGDAGVLPVAVISDASRARALAAALRSGGLPLIEVTLRTPAALDAIRFLAGERDLLVGAGTVTNTADARSAVAAGARFLVSPGLDRNVIQAGRDLGVTVVPGVATATDLQAAEGDGIGVVKLFPAGPLGGPPMVSALAAPFPGTRFIPTGGITADSLEPYLRLGPVLAVGGSWLTPAAAQAAGDFAAITYLAREARAVVDRIRS
jgi:2-dehydro-3-deoxyphosphogluconate aldolase / (4S)-4-hydroxy-2-oxoglutarate aldolase